MREVWQHDAAQVDRVDTFFLLLLFYPIPPYAFSIPLVLRGFNRQKVSTLSTNQNSVGLDFLNFSFSNFSIRSWRS